MVIIIGFSTRNQLNKINIYKEKIFSFISNKNLTKSLEENYGIVIVQRKTMKEQIILEQEDVCRLDQKDSKSCY